MEYRGFKYEVVETITSSWRWSVKVGGPNGWALSTRERTPYCARRNASTTWSSVGRARSLDIIFACYNPGMKALVDKHEIKKFAEMLSELP